MKNNLSKSVLVIGDCILDHSIYTDAAGLSLETPTFKANFVREEYTFGGAANVVRNLLSLGAKVDFVTNISDDEYSFVYKKWQNKNLKIHNMSSDGLNIVKTRIWISRGIKSYKYLQVNRGTNKVLNLKNIKNIDQIIKNCAFDVALMVDYGGGVLDRKAHVEYILEALSQKGITSICSSQTSDKDSRYLNFKNSDFICMNLHEACGVLSFFKPDESCMRQLSKKMNSSVCVTLGEHGAVFYKNDGNFEFQPGQKVNSIDTCGAGDAFLAAFSLNADNCDLKFCNKWAAASTLNIGIGPPNLKDIDSIAE